MIRGRADLVGLLAAMLPPGPGGMGGQLEPVRGALDGRWPDDPLLIPAVETPRMERVVFDGTDPGVRLDEAVAASSALPGFFPPVPIGGREYLDGGVHSPTNADLLAGRGCDLVIVVSPMTPGDAGTMGAIPLVARWSRSRLEEEVEVLEEAGSRVLVLAPSTNVLGSATSLAGPAEAPEIVRRGMLEVGAVLEDPGVAALLAPLATRRARRTADPAAG